MKNNNRDFSTHWLRLICGLVFFWMLLLNLLTPYLADDFPFSFSFLPYQQFPLTKLSQLLPSLSFHYMNWSGRVVVKFFAQGFTMLPKPVFDLCNAAVYTALGVVIYRLAKGKAKKPAPFLMLAIQMGLWQFSPVFGQTNLWMCGSCNYLWATFGCILYLSVWCRNLERSFSPGRLFPLWMGLGGIFTGALSENTSAGMLVGIVLVMAAQLWVKKEKLTLWMFTGLGGSLIGFAFLILAPGNRKRSDAGIDSRSPLTQLLVRFLTCCNRLERHGMILLVLIVLLGVMVYHQKKNWNSLLLPAILLFSALGANFAMIGSSVYYERSTHGVLTLLVACAACLLAQLEKPEFKRLISALLLAALIPVLFSMVYAGYDIASYWMMDHQRDQLIRQEIASGNREVVTYSIACYTRHCAAYGLPDIRQTSEDSVGLFRAWDYGAISILADSVHSYPFPGKTPFYDEDMLALLDDTQLAELNAS